MEDIADFSTYNAVVSLLQDLEQILYLFSSEPGLFWYFKEADVQILYDNLSLMDSLLLDSSGEGYDRKLMGNLEILVAATAYRAQSYIRSCLSEICLTSQIVEESTSDIGGTAGYFGQKIRPEMKFIVFILKQLKKISDDCEALHCLRCAKSAGSVLLTDHWLRRTAIDDSDMYSEEILILRDLFLIWISHHDIMGCDQNLPFLFSEGQINIICDSFSWVKSLLIDSLRKCYDTKLESPGECYDSKSKSGLKNGNGVEDYRVQYSFCSWIRSCLPKPNTDKEKSIGTDGVVRISKQKMHRLTKMIELFNEQVLRIPDDIEILQRTASSGLPLSLTILHKLFKTPNKGNKLVGHFATHDTVLSLLQDLELILSSHNNMFVSEKYLSCPAKGDIQIIYDNLMLMDSLLLETSGQGYDKKIMSSLDNLIGYVVYRSQDYVDSLVQEQTFSSPPNIDKDIGVVQTSFPTMWQIMESTELINHELKNLHQYREFVNKSTQNLRGTTSTGQSFDLLLNQSEPNIENPLTSRIGSAALISRRKLCQLKQSVEFVNNQLRIHNYRVVLRGSSQNFQVTTSIGQSSIVPNMLRRTPNEGNKLVGHENYLSAMLDRLTGYSSKLQVFSVTGMGGIGKTTFTKRLYDDPLVMHHFDSRAWFTISQRYQVREVLIGLLHCLTNLVAEIYQWSDGELVEQVYKSLKGMRYLVVLDDMWDSKAWDDLIQIFPNDENGSRVMLTSRLTDVALYASPNIPALDLAHLSEDESWELLRSKIFMKESCPLELLPIGKQIAIKCQGLPLAIVVVGGLLLKMSQTVEIWKKVAQNITSMVMEEPEHCKNVLALSYRHLPDHLKSCFLYMGIFPEDCKISAKKLIWLWIGEGFIRPVKVKRLEEVAEDYLEDLIARNLVHVHSRKCDGRIKICYIHDLLRDLCLRESHEYNFIRVFNSNEQLMTPVNVKGFPWKPRRLCFHSSNCDSTITSTFSTTHSFLWFKTTALLDHKEYAFPNFKLLKVLDIIDLPLGELPREIFGLSLLIYLSLTFRSSIDRSIFASRLYNLQILIIDGEWNGQLPNEFWHMSKLQHLHVKRSFLSYWPNDSRPNIVQLSSASECMQPFVCRVHYDEHSLKVLQSLHSLTIIRPISCTEDFFLSLPNLRKLGIYENEEDYQFRGWFKYLINLQELRTLKFVFSDPFANPLVKPDRLPSWNSFPPKLMNLILSGTSLPWEDMLKLGELPKLEVLKLKNYAFSGPIWQPKMGGFPRLKYLFIGRTNLQRWEADGDHFPSLQHFVMTYCRSLKEIPSGIGEAPLLEKIELHYCSESAATSAEQILQEQQSYGNDDLTVLIIK